jgi:sugar/nucleoside kinase (ribokinase family)
MDERWKQDKQLWLTLPTQADFGKQNADLFQRLIRSADVVLSNESELMRTYDTTDFNTAIERLREGMAHIREEKAKDWHGNPIPPRTIFNGGPVAFITHGKEGCTVVTEHGRQDFPITPLKEGEQFVNNLGSGDTAFAGFASGLLLGLPHKDCAKLAMTLAKENLRHNGPRIPDPVKALSIADPLLAHQFFSALKQHLPEASIAK